VDDSGNKKRFSIYITKETLELLEDAKEVFQEALLRRSPALARAGHGTKTWSDLIAQICLHYLGHCGRVREERPPWKIRKGKAASEKGQPPDDSPTDPRPAA
jgi:hypothetical protein